MKVYTAVVVRTGAGSGRMWAASGTSVAWSVQPPLICGVAVDAVDESAWMLVTWSVRRAPTLDAGQTSGSKARLFGTLTPRG